MLASESRQAILHKLCSYIQKVLAGNFRSFVLATRLRPIQFESDDTGSSGSVVIKASAKLPYLVGEGASPMEYYESQHASFDTRLEIHNDEYAIGQI